MDMAILIVLIVLSLLVLVLIGCSVAILLKRPEENISSALKSHFLEFQTNIQTGLNETRKEVTESKGKIDENAIKTLQTINQMDKTVQKIIQQQEEAHKLGESLKDILAAPKLRGNYGEEILEEMLDRILPKGIWESQYNIESGPVDAVVKYRDVIIPIDAKFPRDDYIRYLEAESDEDKKRHWAAYESAVKNQIRSIASKYVKPEKGTSEFALMFIPSEATYYETIADKNYLGQPSRIFEFARDNKVFPVSPNTFYAFLQIIIHGVRNLEVITSAKKIQEGLKDVQRSFEGFYKKYEDIGRKIEIASDAYRIGNDHIQRFKKRVDSTLELEKMQEFEKLDS